MAQTQDFIEAAWIIEIENRTEELLYNIPRLDDEFLSQVEAQCLKQCWGRDE